MYKILSPQMTQEEGKGRKKEKKEGKKGKGERKGKEEKRKVKGEG